MGVRGLEHLMDKPDDPPTCWCELTGPEYGHIWDVRVCPPNPVPKTPFEES